MLSSPVTVHPLSAFLAFLLLCSGLARANVPAPAATSPKPWESHALDLSTGVLWGLKRNTPLAYRMVPTELSWRSPLAFNLHEFADGGRLIIRHRLTLIASWIDQGPESRYLAFSGSPSIERWNAAGTWAVVGGAGGGFGWLDARGVAGGQGQDFTLNWFARAGLEHAPSPHRRLSAGMMFQHLSNGGQTDPNPGVDAVGFTLMHSWAF